MRFSRCLLSEGESQALIDDVDRWCRRTGTNYNRLVIAARVAVTIRHKVRVKRQRVTIPVATRLRLAMAQKPHGITREEHKLQPKPWGGYPAAAKLEVKRTEPQRVDRTPCPKCGVRADVGCHHSAPALSAYVGGGIRVA